MKRKVLIYGGSGGIGSATARLLADRGFDLHLVGRDERRLTEIAKATSATMTVGDVLDESLFEQVASACGPELNGLVYAVGTITLKSLQRLQSEAYDRDFRVNAKGAALAVAAAVPALKKGQGVSSVVLFSSVAASQGFAFHASIGMAKAAVSGLTLALAAELAPRVRVNAIAPSLVRTPLAAPLLTNDQVAESISGLHALSRLGTPEDIAALTAFLVSEESEWMTGQVIGIDGGRSTLRAKG